jgi:hypothetical protein
VLGARLTDGGDDVFWLAVVILSRPVSSCPITVAVVMVAMIVRAAVAMTPVVRVIIVVVRRAMSACILVEAHLGFLDVSVLVGHSYHLADTGGWLAVEFGVKLVMVESSNKGSDDFSFCNVGNRVPHLGETSDVATEKLEWLLVDAAEIMLGARSSTHGHIVVGEDFLQLFP